MDRLIIESWKTIFTIFRITTDNVFLVIFFTSVLFAFCMFLFRKKFVKHSYVFLLPEWIYLISVGYMVHRLPLIHERLQTALATVSNIILSSKTYSSDFQNISGIKELSSENIASYIYFVEKPFSAEPEMLFDKCFSTLDQIRRLPFLGEVHKSCFGSFTGMFLIMTIVILLIWIVTITQSGTRFRFIIAIIQSIIIISLSFWNNGALFAGMVVWIIEVILNGIFVTQE